VGVLHTVHFPEGATVGYAAGIGIDSIGGPIAVAVKTTDGGGTWAPLTTGVTDPIYSIYFKDNSTGFAVGSAGLAIRTTDGGTTWTPMTVPGVSNDALNRVQFPENGQIGYIGAYPRSMGGKVLKTTDGGSTWSSISVGSPLQWSYSVGMATDNIGAVVGKGGMVLMTSDGFASAPTISGPLTTADIVAAAFSPTDPTKGYLIGNDSIQGVIRYTDDGGAGLWDTVRCRPVTAFYGIDMPTSDVAYVCGDSASVGIIYRSLYATDFWKTTITGAPSTLYGVCFPNGVDTGYAVGSGGVILKTVDGGAPWIPGIAEGKVPAVTRAGIRVMSNPSRNGIAFHSDQDVAVTVFDASGRALMSRAATRGLNFLSLPTGAYFVKAGASTARAVVTD
jgi:photosystem II stability/assembly factor-like uncharacterized protein